MHKSFFLRSFSIPYIDEIYYQRYFEYIDGKLYFDAVDFSQGVLVGNMTMNRLDRHMSGIVSFDTKEHIYIVQYHRLLEESEEIEIAEAFGFDYHPFVEERS